MYPFASLPENLAAFCEALRRQHGFHIGPGELHDAARALDVVDLGDERAVRHALRPILSGTLDEVMLFDEAFRQFFFQIRQVFVRIKYPRPGESPERTPMVAKRMRRMHDILRHPGPTPTSGLRRAAVR